jgi:signal transduction histidine kinase
MIVDMLRRAAVQTMSSKTLMFLLIAISFIALGLIIFFFRGYTKQNNIPHQPNVPNPLPDTSTPSPQPITSSSGSPAVPSASPFPQPNDRKSINTDLIGLVLSGFVLLVLLAVLVVGVRYTRKLRNMNDIEKLLTKNEKQLAIVEKLEAKIELLKQERREETRLRNEEEMKKTKLQHEKKKYEEQRTRLIKLTSRLRTSLSLVYDSNDSALGILKIYSKLTKVPSNKNFKEFFTAVKQRLENQQKMINDSLDEEQDQKPTVMEES